MANKALVVIQDLTYTEKEYGLGVTVSYVNAAALSVSTVGHAITVNITASSTATQIAAAVTAHHDAQWLVTCVVTGTGTNVQRSCKNATLSGGVIAAKAILNIGSLRLTAAATGTGGNSVTVVLTPGATAGAEVVSVISSAITIQIAEGVSTYAQVKTAYDLVGAATTLAVTSSSGTALSNVARVAHCRVATNLAGGVAAAKASVANQDLTYASDLTGVVENGRTVTYTDGGTAGAEVVTVGADTNVSILMQSGTSTATNIATACAAATALDGVKATGSIAVSDYTNLHLTAASGTVTFGTPDNLTKASGTVTVTDYALLHKQKALVVVQDLTYTAVAFGTGGNSITVQYVSDISGNFAVVEVPTANTILVHMDETAVTGTTANTIKAAVNADTQALALVLVSGASANVQAAQAVTPLADGQNASTVTVNGVVLTESTEWTAGTDNDTSAASLASAITTATATTLCTAAAVATNVCTITANTAGVGGNSIALATSDAVKLLKSAAALAGGKVASTITVAGTTFTKVASAPGPTDFVAIANLTTLIQALASVNATDDATTVTVVAATAGTAGNAIAMSKTGAGLTCSALLSGGVNASTVTVAGHVLTESTEWTASADANTTATSLASAIDGLSEVAATATLAVVNIVGATTGVVGNVALLTSDAVRLLKSGAALTGGVDGLDCTVTGTGGTAQVTVNGKVTAGAVGAGADAYFADASIVALTSGYVIQNWHFHGNLMIIVNDETTGNKTVAYSYDGVNLHGTLTAGQSITMDIRQSVTSLWLKYVNAAPAYRLSVK